MSHHQREPHTPLHIRFCTRCGRPCGPHPVKLADIHTATGPGRTAYACPTCASYYPQLAIPPEEL